jgi:hypothetical protein
LWLLKQFASLPPVSQNPLTQSPHELPLRQNIKPDAWTKFRDRYLPPNDSEKGVELRNDHRKEEPSAMQILSVLADAFKAQTEIIKSIESKMARESTLATISTNLQKAMLDVQTLSSRQLGVAPTVLASLERIEKLAPGTLQQEADRTIGQIEKEAYTHDSAAALNR